MEPPTPTINGLILHAIGWVARRFARLFKRSKPPANVQKRSTFCSVFSMSFDWKRGQMSMKGGMARQTAKKTQSKKTSKKPASGNQVAGTISTNKNALDRSKIDLQQIAVSKINPAPYNPRKDLKPGDREYEKLKRSIEAYGCVEPLVWNQRTGNLVGGHQRFKVIMTEQSPKTLSVSVVDLDEGDEKALNVALNKISGEWDTVKLGELLQDVVDLEGFDPTLTGFDEDEMNNAIAAMEADLDAMKAAEASGSGSAPGSGDGEGGASGDDSGGGGGGIESVYQVLAQCSGEAEQKKVYDLLKANGVKCRILTVE